MSTKSIKMSPGNLIFAPDSTFVDIGLHMTDPTRACLVDGTIDRQSPIVTVGDVFRLGWSNESEMQTEGDRDITNYEELYGARAGSQ